MDGYGLRAAGLLAALALVVGCSAEGEDGGGSSSRQSSGSDSTNFGNSNTSSSSSNGDQDFGNTNTTGPAPPTGGFTPVTEPGTVEFSYIWIANSAEGTVSKLDTRTMTELGRYRTRPDGAGRPSRTSVALSGDVAIANRDGGITKYFAREENCTDKNGNGVIDTSTGSGDVKAWMEDECLAWHTPLTYFSNRPVAWAPAPSPDAPAKVWTAAAVPPGGAPCGPFDCTIDVMRLDGTTGTVEDKITISGLAGTDFIGGGVAGGVPIPFAGVVIENYGPYGGASDAGGNFWVFVGNTTQLVRVDAFTMEYRVWPIEPVGNGYGITIDSKGRVYVCGALGVSRFDPGTETWLTSNGVVLGMNGCMVGPPMPNVFPGATPDADVLWVGGGSDQGTPGLHAFDAETLAHLGSYAGDATVKGVSIDVDGKVWGVGSQGFGGLGLGNGTTAWRLEPGSGAIDTYTGLNGAYSYSDMTGFGLKAAGVTLPPD